MRRLLPFVIVAVLSTAAAEPLSVPFVRQQKQGCGPAVVSMLFQYWESHGSRTPVAWTPSALYDHLYNPRVRGVTGDAMIEFLREQDFVTFTFRGEWNDLVKNTDLGRPVIAALAPKKGDPIHFVLVVGVDQQSSAAIIHDPDRGANVSVPLDRFLKEWNGTQRWTLLAVPRTRSEQFHP